MLGSAFLLTVSFWQGRENVRIFVPFDLDGLGRHQDESGDRRKPSPLLTQV